MPKIIVTITELYMGEHIYIHSEWQGRILGFLLLRLVNI
jgi:hypothetical protein